MSVSATPHDFTSSLKKGDKGEQLVLNYLSQNPNIAHIEDVSGDKIYQEKDIDFIITFNSGKVQTLEIKTDFYKSPNMFYELISAEETGSLGCFEKTEAERLIYYFYNLNIMYTFDMPKYRDWVHEQKELFERRGYVKRLKNYRYNGGTYTSVGYAFPRRLLDDPTFTWVSKKLINLEEF